MASFQQCILIIVPKTLVSDIMTLWQILIILEENEKKKSCKKFCDYFSSFFLIYGVFLTWRDDSLPLFLVLYYSCDTAVLRNPQITATTGVRRGVLANLPTFHSGCHDLNASKPYDPSPRWFYRRVRIRSEALRIKRECISETSCTV